MTILEEERMILKNTRRDMYKSKDRDSINKIYRQARVWNRYHYFIGQACTRQKYEYINKKFKNYRRDALAALR